MGFPEEINADGSLVLWWRQNDTSGTAAADSGGSAHPGTYNGTVTLNRTSGILTDTPTSLAVLYDGSTAFLRADSSFTAMASNAQRTFRIWASRSAHAAQDVLFSSSGGNAMLRLSAAAPADVNWFADTGGASSNWSAAWPGDNQFIELVLEHDDTAQTDELFINGVSQGSLSAVTKMAAVSGTIVGARGTTQNFFHGTIHDFIVESFKPSAARVLAGYNAAVNDDWLYSRAGVLVPARQGLQRAAGW